MQLSKRIADDPAAFLRVLAQAELEAILSNDSDYRVAGETMVHVKLRQKEIEDKWREAKSEAFRAHKDICAEEASELAPYKEVYALLSDARSRYRDDRQQENEPGLVLPEPEGVSTKEVWCYEITNADEVPRQWCVPDEKKIGKAAREMKTLCRIPGVRVWVEHRETTRLPKQ